MLVFYLFTISDVMFTLRGALSQLYTHRAARTGFCVRSNAGNYRLLVRGTLCTCENFQLISTKSLRDIHTFSCVFFY